MTELNKKSEYKNWLVEIKSKIKNIQIKVAVKINTELIQLYWDIGAMIVDKQETAKWGSKFIEQIAKDLKEEFPDLTGFSKDNLYFMKRFYSFYYETFTFVEQAVQQIEFNENLEQVVQQMDSDEIIYQSKGHIENNNLLKKIFLVPWGHHILILKKIKNIGEALFYISETIENNWSRSVLEYQIQTNLYNRQGKAISNFKLTLPETDGDLAQQLLKDPYDFSFIGLGKKAKERDLEDKLVEHITQFLLELGKGFAYMGRQFQVKVGTKSYRTDLLFYHTKLKAYIIIELKMKEFEPEFVGKLNFYVTAINELIKDDEDKETIGILLCKNKDDLVVDFSLRDVNKPIGVSEFTYTELPEEIQNVIPTAEEFKNKLNEINN